MEIISLDKNKAIDAFNKLNEKYKEFKNGCKDQNYNNFRKELDNSIKVIHDPLEARVNEYLEKANYDVCKLTLTGNFSVSLEMNTETIKLWGLIQKCLDENSKYWEEKAKKMVSHC